MSEPVHVSSQPIVGLTSGVSGNMIGNITSLSVNINEIVSYAIQAVFTGAPIGNIELQGSNDGVNFTLIPESYAAVTGAGSYLINVELPGYSYVQVVYTFASGTGSMTAIINTKRR
jgi:hypothetical protein